MNTPKSCHNKEQYFTEHNLYSCSKFVHHKCNIYHSVPNLLDTDAPSFAVPAVDHIKQFVQVAQAVKVTHLALCKAADLP